jgi:hypothetical protein
VDPRFQILSHRGRGIHPPGRRKPTAQTPVESSRAVAPCCLPGYQEAWHVPGDHGVPSRMSTCATFRDSRATDGGPTGCTLQWRDAIPRSTMGSPLHPGLDGRQQPPLCPGRPLAGAADRPATVEPCAVAAPSFDGAAGPDSSVTFHLLTRKFSWIKRRPRAYVE